MHINYDLHTHIIPYIDDGAQSIEESLSLIEALNNQGVENIVFTPHFYTHKESAEDFISRREEAFKKLKDVIPDYVNVKLGAEVYVTDYLFAQERDLSPLCIEGTNYMITEFSYDSDFTGRVMRRLTRLRDLGFIPVLPHVERYPALMKKKSKLEELIDMGVIIQSNFSSFTEPSKARKLLKFLNCGYIHILSTDVHGFGRNAPDSIRKAMDIITKKCSFDVIHTLSRNARDVFEGR